MRLFLALSLPLLTGSAAPTAIPDARGMGEILAKADGPNLFVTALFFLLFLQFVERLWASGSSARAITKAAETKARAVDRMTDAIEAGDRNTIATLNLLQRDLDRLLDRQEREK